MKLNIAALSLWFGKIPSHFISGMAAGSISGAGVGAISFSGDAHAIGRSAFLGLVIAGVADVRSFIKLNPMPDLFASEPASPSA